jgi:hypothetical protein
MPPLSERLLSAITLFHCHPGEGRDPPFRLSCR